MIVPMDVVVVDDADDARRVVELQLGLSGRFRVVGSGATGSEAVALAARHQPSVLLLDASMPERDGLEALPAIRAASPATRVVMLSGFDSRELRAAALERGATGFLHKSVSLEDLPGTLLELLEPPGDRGRGTPAAPGGAGERAPRPGSEALVRHLERFRTVFDQAAIGMATMTLTGTVVRANAVLAQLVDASDESALVGRDYAALAAPADREPVSTAIREAADGGVALTELDHRLAGPSRILHASFAPVTGPDGRPLYLFAQAEDVTWSRTTAEELRRSEERFKLLVASVRDYAIFMLDPTGRVATWNLGAERLKGYRTEEIVGQHFRVFYPPEVAARGHPEHELEVATREGRYEEEGWRVRKDGSRFYANVVITALFDTEGKLAGFGKVTRDITERYQQAEARERFAEELQAANVSLQDTADAMASFLAVVAHELRNPIVTVSGAAKLLGLHWDQLDAGEREDMLASITRGARQLTRLLDDLLLASRLEAGSFELRIGDVAIAPMIAEVLDELRPVLPCEVEVDCPAGLDVRADPDRLAQILVNLVSNAAKHGRPPIRVEACWQEERIELRVIDAGPGIGEELRPRLFEKFAQGPGTARRGTGLGLFIVRQLARGMGGDAWYEPSPASCFAVSLRPAEARAVTGHMHRGSSEAHP